MRTGVNLIIGVRENKYKTKQEFMTEEDYNSKYEKDGLPVGTVINYFSIKLLRSKIVGESGITELEINDG